MRTTCMSRAWPDIRCVVFVGALTAGFAVPGLLPGTVQAEEDFPETPFLRLETGMHTALIRRIDVDRAGRYLVTGSQDKTVRVWDLGDGRLLRTLRIPIGSGDLGKVYAVALSPDGDTVAVGGWTGYIKWGGYNIYLFERGSGVLRGRIELVELNLSLNP